MAELPIDFDALRRTDGDFPWQAIEAAVNAIVAEPARWKELLPEYDVGYEVAYDLRPMYIAAILGLAAEQLAAAGAAPPYHEIAEFILDELTTAAENDDDLLLDDLQYAAGRLGPAILPQVLERLDILAAGQAHAGTPSDDEDGLDGDAAAALWSLLPLAARSPDEALRREVARRAMAALESILAGNAASWSAIEPFCALASLRWTPALDLLDRLGRAKRDELESAMLWPDYLETVQIIQGNDPPYGLDEWWEAEPRKFLDQRRNMWKNCQAEANDAPAADSDTDYDQAARRMATWPGQFAASPFAAALPDADAESIAGDAQTLLQHGLNYIGADVADWGITGWHELLLEVLPRKVSADAAWFKTQATLAAALLRWLDAAGHAPGGAALADKVGAWGSLIEAAAADPRNWGMAKSFFMAGKDAGFDMTNQAQSHEFMARYNAQLAAGRGALDTGVDHDVGPKLKYGQGDPWSAQKPFVREEPKVGRNDPCRCGSGKKHKKCCGR